MKNHRTGTFTLAGSRELAAAPEQLWAALHDPDVLAASIRGCEEVVRLSPTEYRAVLAVGVGRIVRRFTAGLEVIPEAPPACYRLTCRVDGRTGEAAVATAKVQLAATGPGATRLEYTADITLRGPLGRLGGRALAAAANRHLDRFWARLAVEIDRRM